VSAGGVEAFRVTANQFLFRGGSASAPAFSFFTETNLGFYHNDGLGIVFVGGSANDRLRIYEAEGLDFVAVPATLFAHGSDENGGSAATPAFAFMGTDQDTGLFWPGAGSVAITADGTERVRVTTAGVTLGTHSVTFGSAITTPESGIAQVSSGFLAARQPQQVEAQDQRSALVARAYRVAHTASATLDRIHTGSVRSNAGAAGIVTLTLPNNAVDGTTYRFVSVGGNALRVDPAAGDNLVWSGGTMADGEYLQVTGGGFLVVYDATSTAWEVTAESGVLVEEAP
jgi:hypothetical protein